MRTRSAFLVGLLIGAAAGIAATLAFDPREPADTVLPSSDASAGKRHVATLEARGTPSSGPTDARTMQPPEAAPAPAQEPKSAEQADYRARLDAVRAQLKQVRAAEPGSATVLDVMKAFRALIEDSDPQLSRLGVRALIRLAGSGKLRDEDVAGMAKEFETLEPGAAARPALAGAVALAWARDRRLAAWLDGLPAVKEPDIRAAVLVALDESASSAYREYILRISRSEQDPDVLAHAWHEDPITVAMTRDWAPRLITTIERRIEEGGLPPIVRGRALFAIGLAAVHEASASAAAIGRLVGGEDHAGVQAYGRAVLDAIAREEANVQTLDRLWAQHHAALAKD